MKLKIFNKALFTLLCVMAANGAFAQKKADSLKEIVIVPDVKPMQFANMGKVFENFDINLGFQQDSNYRKEYRKMQEQMTELREKMSKLRAEEMRKNADKMRKRSQENTERSFETLKNFSYNYNDNVSGDSKGLGVPSNIHFNYRGEKGDDYIKKKIASGEVKEKTKSYTKSYAVDKDDKIQLDNSFGKITINTWPKNEVKVDVQIKADADDDASAQKLLDAVTINDNKTESAVSFKTIIDDNNRISNHYNVHKTEVNYVVYMPAKNPLTINNRFGGIKMPDLSGKVTVNLSYGSLNAQELINPLNEVTVKFGDANIAALKSTSVNVSYGNLNIGTADNLNAKLSFSSGNVNQLRSSGDFSVKYGAGLKVGQLTNVKNLNVDASFTKVLVNVKDDYDFDVNTKMGNFSYDGNSAVKVLNTTPDSERGYSSTKSYKGHVGKGNAEKTITIKSTYGNVKFDDQ